MPGAQSTQLLLVRPLHALEMYLPAGQSVQLLQAALFSQPHGVLMYWPCAQLDRQSAPACRFCVGVHATVK